MGQTLYRSVRPAWQSGSGDHVVFAQREQEVGADYKTSKPTLEDIFSLPNLFGLGPPQLFRHHSLEPGVQTHEPMGIIHIQTITS